MGSSKITIDRAALARLQDDVNEKGRAAVRRGFTSVGGTDVDALAAAAERELRKVGVKPNRETVRTLAQEEAASRSQ
jgi:hypothetical protein